MLLVLCYTCTRSMLILCLHRSQKSWSWVLWATWVLGRGIELRGRPKWLPKETQERNHLIAMSKLCSLLGTFSPLLPSISLFSFSFFFLSCSPPSLFTLFSFRYFFNVHSVFICWLWPSPTLHFLSFWSDVGEPSSKKPRTSSVVVEQTGESEKLLIDQVADTEAFFDEVVSTVF